MAVQAASLAASKTAQVLAQPGSNLPAASAMFADLLAALNPAANAKSLKATTAAAPGQTQTPAEAKPSDDPNTNLAAALAAMHNGAPLPVQTQTALAPTNDNTSITDATAQGGKPVAGLKAVDPAQLRAALTAPAQPAKPGTPTLPVTAGQGDTEEGEDIPAASAKDIAAKLAPSDVAQTAANAAQHLLKPVTPAQTTQAQVAPVKFDAKPDAQNNNANTDSNGSQNGQPDHQHTTDAQTPAQTTPPAQPVAHAVTAAAQPAPAEVKVAETTAAPSSNGVTPIQTAQPVQATQATLHVAQASSAATASPQPDIAALAVSIAAKSAGGAKHFDIRLDPPELGHIDVHLSVDDTGKAQAHLSAEKPQTLELLQRDSGTLTKQLKDSGVDLGSNGLQFSLRGQDQGGGNAASRQAQRGRALAVSAVADTAPVSSQSLATDSARLDIRV
ncbi:MAG TPA: flagellar hook-length control protein FliK [Rhizomicrobium sp.]|nr:flagellar hook-length control protein FliK [Rhizomicrobium sp.]